MLRTCTLHLLPRIDRHESGNDKLETAGKKRRTCMVQLRQKLSMCVNCLGEQIQSKSSQNLLEQKPCCNDAVVHATYGREAESAWVIAHMRRNSKQL